jgi:hypothetical protein
VTVCPLGQFEECLVRGDIGRNKKKLARDFVKARRDWSLIAAVILVRDSGEMVQWYADDTPVI